MKFLKLQHIAIAIPVVLCILAPTANSTQDAYAYAADARWGAALFSAHHLFYTVQLFLIAQLFAIRDTLALGKFINSLYVGGSLIVLYQILKVYLKAPKHAAAYTFFTGCSFAILRFGTENEAYIPPVFFSLAGTFFYLSARDNLRTKRYLIAGFFTALACLFHQIQFFWWLALAIGTLNSTKTAGWKLFLLYSVPALMVPAAYALVLVFSLHQPLTLLNLFHFVFETFFTGSSSLGISIMTVSRWVLSIARTFVQVHPTLLLLSKFHIGWLLGAYLAGAFLVFAIVRTYLKNFNLSFHINVDGYIYSAIIACNLLYSFLDKGNSEFMVMIPYLVVLLCSVAFAQPVRQLWLMGSAMLLWNITVALVPLNLYNFLTYPLWAEKIQKNPDGTYFMYDGIEIQNILYYHTGKSPANCHTLHRVPPEKIKKQIDNLLQNHRRVFTNYLATPLLKNSSALMIDATAKNTLKTYQATIADSVSLFGEYEYLLQVNSK